MMNNYKFSKQIQNSICVII